MSTLPMLFVSVVLGAAPDLRSPKVAPPSPQQVRQAVERSLPYLLQSSEAWREKHKCVTCHQVPFAVWGLNEAKARGFAVDQKRLENLTDWSLQFCTTDKDKGKPTGGFLSTMVKTTLALETAPRSKNVIEAFEFFEPLLAGYQKPEGWWKEGNFIGVKDAEKEGIEVDTMWTVLALAALEDCGDALSEKARESLAKNRQRALDWLKDAKPGTRSDWLALKMVVEGRFGEKETAAAWRKALLNQQNPDGGWPFVRGGDSHPLVTGEALYTLSVAGVGEDAAVVQRAWKHLLGSQQPDGSWKAISRQKLGAGKPEHINDVTIHWGTGWATIGLLRTLPREDRPTTSAGSAEASGPSPSPAPSAAPN